MTGPDGFTFYADRATESAGMWCDRCPFDPVLRDVQGSTLQEVADAARAHDAEAHG